LPAVACANLPADDALAFLPHPDFVKKTKGRIYPLAMVESKVSPHTEQNHSKKRDRYTLIRIVHPSMAFPSLLAHHKKQQWRRENNSNFASVSRH
jgi:hypothetical protein